MTNPSEVVADLRIAAEDARRFSAALFDRGYVRREGVRPFSELLERAADTIDRLTSSGEAVGVMVKPLQWKGDKATTPFGVYAVTRTPDGYQGSLGYDELCHVGFNAGRPFESAKEAARHHVEEHYTNAILSAIETALIPTKPEAKEDEVERLCAALKPFADFIGDDTRLPDDMPLTQGSAMAKRQVTVADFRRARSALQSKKPE